MGRDASAAKATARRASARFPVDLMYSAARLYYLEDANQAEIAERLGTSRATVSRLLSEARRHGIVQIRVVPPPEPDDGLGERVSSALGLEAVYLAPQPADGAPDGAMLAPALSAALSAVGLRSGDVLLCSSGRTVYEVAQGQLPRLPGVVVVPTVGGQDEPEPWYQTNEITRQFAAKVGGSPSFLYAPALPGPELYRLLLEEPTIRRVIELWHTARCAVLGVGGPPLTRESIPRFVPTDAVSLRQAVGDVCSRFYDRDGEPVAFPGSERLISTSLESLRRVPVGIAVAVGRQKVAGILAGARAAYFNRLVTDRPTATGLLDEADGHSVSSSPCGAEPAKGST